MNFLSRCFVLLFACSTVSAASLHPIHLRNQTIAPKVAKSLQPSKSLAPDSTLSGLYLIQFKDPPSAESRARLSALGVDLLHYVPEHTFIARLQNTRHDQLRSLPFVQWLGEYRPEHKVHSSVTAKSKELVISGQTFPVTVLMAPRLTSSDLTGARKGFASVQAESILRAGTILRGHVTSAQLDSLSRSHLVLWIEPYHPMKLVDEVASKIVAGDGGAQRLLAQSLGYDGAGVKVAVADSGLNNGDAASMHPDLLGRTPSFFFYGSLTDAADEHSHGTHVSGIIAGNGATGETDPNGALYGLGVAPGASIIAQRIFDGVGNFEPPVGGFEQLTREAKTAGADIGSNSWGDDTQGQYDASAMEFDALVRDANSLALGDQQYILEFSAGNAGPGGQTIGSPAVAKNVIATGASENDREDLLIYDDGPEAMADFSSRGPCADGRIKPDVVAPGTWISSLQSQSASDIYAWAPIDDLYQYQGGTSQAGPHASGAAAVFVQFYRQSHTNATPSPALVKAALINSATDMDDDFGTDPVPNNDEGWGRVDLTPFFDSSLNFDYVDQSILLTNTQIFERRLVVSGPGQPVKVTLVYTDVPGFPGAAKALVNDLDLEVVAPDGRLYLGNQFQNGSSVPNPPGPDALNNVEGVFLPEPLAGQYIIRVRARAVQQDARGDTTAIDQDFALVTSAAFASAGQGILSLDHASYRAPSQIKVILTDTDLAGSPSVSVSIKSTTEPAGETITLHPSDSSGVFTASVATATGPPLPDGQLQISDNDLITASYFDVSSGITRTATARGDLVPPILTGITATNSFGEETIYWSSNERGTSIVRYGTNNSLSSLALAVTNNLLTTSHTLSLDSLVVGRTYYFYVVSSDEAGNTATNSNGGALFSFVVPPVAPLLLIDEYNDDANHDFGVPPLSGYTNALNQVGIGYDVFYASGSHLPTLNNLRLYRAVIWRVPDLQGVWTTPEQSAISNYLYSGGSLFVASMEVLSRLEEVGATNFIHNVLQVQSYVPDPDSSGALEIIGSPNEAVGNGLDITMDYTVYSDLWDQYIQFGIFPDPPDFSDTVTPAANASPMLHNDSGDVVGLRWPAVGHTAPGRLVFVTFPFDAVPMSSGVNDRVNLLRNILSFLAPGASGLGTVALDSPAYALPATVTIEVGDSDLAGQGTLNVTAFSTTQTAGLTVALQETSNRGDFIGSFQLISSTNPPTAGKLRAMNGDTLRVDYFDASVSHVISASAAVDTVAPAIANVFADPDYEQAAISWTTSENADALVQYGESAFLNRTAYDPNLKGFHTVEVDNLLPDHTYYYQVTSRDAAGNTTTDDNHGNLYTFHTRQPIVPPWFDNLETGATNWSVVTSDGSQTEWTLGVPNNGQETAAHSPTNAWGSNLKGDVIDSAETFLVSPAINLTGGNVATLRFWHSYDFSFDPDLDILNEGDLFILTKNATVQTPLATYSDDLTPGYVQEVIDLTPYMGQVVYIVWAHELFTFDSRPQPGWLVDDVSITVTNIAPGIIQISNNLWQASFILSGPSYRQAKGLSLVITNAAPGQYIINFADVQYYNTPLSQTNTLASGATISFTGNYTFTDINSNGIPDSWELQYFGVVSTNRTRFTDTDGDGMSDYAEFIAGTDPNHPQAGFTVSIEKLSASSARLKWPGAPGQMFRVLSSTNLVSWTSYLDWFTASNAQPSVTIPLSTGAGKSFYRVQSAALNLPSDLPPTFRVTAQKLVNGKISIGWSSSIGRGYRVYGSTNALTWTPISDWIQASSINTSFTLPTSAPGSPFLFRVQVQP